MNMDLADRVELALILANDVRGYPCRCGHRLDGGSRVTAGMKGSAGCVENCIANII